MLACLPILKVCYRSYLYIAGLSRNHIYFLICATIHTFDQIWIWPPSDLMESADDVNDEVCRPKLDLFSP